ncbi:MAG: hypothetical protein R3F56_09005 [Planctomycetota bacterium]
MASYTPDELRDGLEFKILRSATSRFKDPEFLRKSLQEEAAAGWTLVEKFDNGRIRLKRPAAAQQHDSSVQFDPYRTSVGMSEGQLAFLIVLGIVTAVVLILTIARALR